MTRRIRRSATTILILMIALHTQAASKQSFSDAFIKAYKAGYDKMKAGRHAEALNEFRVAAGIAKTNHEKGPVYTRIGQCLAAQQKWQEAANAFEQATRLPIPGKYERKLRHQRHVEDAFKSLIEIYSGRLKKTDKAVEVLKTMSAYEGIHPHHLADHMKRLAEGCTHQKQYDRAVKIMHQALAVKGLNDDKRSELLGRLGWIHEYSGKHETALAFYRQASELPEAPPHRVADAIKHMGEIYERRLRQPKEALKYYKRMRDLPGVQPHHKAEARLRMANVHRRLKQFDQALAACREVVDAKASRPNHVSDALKRIGEIQERDLKDPAAGLETYKRILGLPGLHPHHKSEAQLRIAHNLRNQHRYQDALAAYGKVLEIKKGHRGHLGDATLNAGRMLADNLKKYDQALQWFAKTVAFEGAYPDHRFEALLRSARIYETVKKQPEDVSKCYIKARDLTGLHPHRQGEAQWRLANSFLAQQKNDLAREALKRLLEMKDIRANTRKNAQDAMKKLHK